MKEKEKEKKSNRLILEQSRNPARDQTLLSGPGGGVQSKMDMAQFQHSPYNLCPVPTSNILILFVLALDLLVFALASRVLPHLAIRTPNLARAAIPLAVTTRGETFSPHHFIPLAATRGGTSFPHPFALRVR